jgi:hypothetical protein
MFADIYTEPRTGDPSREQTTTLALGLPNTKHKLELIAEGSEVPKVREIRVYRPPVHSPE